MFGQEFDALSNGAVAKSNLLKKNPLGYLLLSALAGMYIGFGNLLTNVEGGLLNGAPYTKIVMGVSFGVALSLVVMAGAELFTGNNLVMMSGVLKKKLRMSDACKVWAVCWIGNLLGAIILALLFHFSGMNTEAVSTFLATGAAAKMSAPFVQLLMRGILCNILVCLATWCGVKLKNEAAKLIMVWWCLFAFVTCGFEHSIANMTQLTVALLDPAGQAVTIGGYFYNLITVTIGNMIGGILFVAVPYYIAQLKDQA
ncbi:MAG: formate/nitrite transporter family protein [Eubacterium sp.]|nr:formate/nitrite transporter family protein [Eubacterium sp.]